MNISEILAKLSTATVKTLADARAFLAEAINGLSAAVDQLKIAAEEVATLKAAIVAKDADLAAAQLNINELAAKLSTAEEQAATAVSGTISVLSSSGIKVDKLEPEPLKAALKARVESEAQTLLAARGIKPLPEEPRATTDLAEPALNTDAAILAKYESMPAGPERIAFLDQHRDAIWRGQTAR